MSQYIRIRKGLDIKLKGVAQNKINQATRPKIFAIRPTDIHGVIPKMVKRVGDKVKAGEEIYYSKSNKYIKFVSPVSGVISEVVRGEKRKILSIEISADSQDDYLNHGAKDPLKLSRDKVKEQLLISGCWPFIKQRPYDVIANPDDTPKSIFISANATAPLAADYGFALQGQQVSFQTGINALIKLTDGIVHLSVCVSESSFLVDVNGVELHRISGKHPAGNVGVQIHHISPISQGERIWVVNPQDVVAIGSMFNSGIYDSNRVIALVGSEVNSPQYYKTIQGGSVIDLVNKNVNTDNVRVISGDVLTGTNIGIKGTLGFYDNLVSVIPEGNHYDFLGWLPFTKNNKFSMSRLFFSWLLPKKRYNLNTNLNGELRALVVTGEMEKVMQMDIFPMHLLKASMVGDIERMEKLGIYEVAPEDFALVDFINTSKIEAQEIIRKALDLMIKEVG